MSTHITYLFDPLCGWCYGAAPAVQRLAKDPSVSLALACCASSVVPDVR